MAAEIEPAVDPPGLRTDFRGCGKLMPAKLRARLAAAVERRGLYVTARLIGIAPSTILRALAAPSAGVRHGTICAVELGLAKIEASQQSAASAESAPTAAERGRP